MLLLTIGGLQSAISNPAIRNVHNHFVLKVGIIPGNRVEKLLTKFNHGFHGEHGEDTDYRFTQFLNSSQSLSLSVLYAQGSTLYVLRSTLLLLGEANQQSAIRNRAAGELGEANPKSIFCL